MKKGGRLFAVVFLLTALCCGIACGALRGSRSPASETAVDSGKALAESDGSVPAAEASPALSVSDADAMIHLAQDGTIWTGEGVSLSGNTVTIRLGGVYLVDGELTNGQVVVDAGGKSDVTLMLRGATLRCEKDAAIRVEDARSVCLYLAEGTENAVTSGQPGASGETADESATGGAIYARDDLTIDGSGALAVAGYVNNGLQCTNDLVIKNGEIRVTAINHGVKGKDSVMISGGNLAIESGGDGIRSDDTSEAGHGTVTLSGGRIDIKSDGDGVFAATKLDVTGGEIAIVAGAGSSDVSQSYRSEWRGRERGWDMEDDEGVSTKGLKSGASLHVAGGSLTIDARDDALHSDGDLTVTGGALSVASGDDGLHAETLLTVSGGVLTVTRSYEGLEGEQVLIEGGTLSVTAYDDGLNANGGSSFPNGRGRIDSGDETWIRITGGEVSIDAQGDGIDSNGDLVIEGGFVLVDGPSESMNGALDTGGVCTVGGGTVLAIGASGMAVGFDDASSQCSFAYRLNGEAAAGSVIRVLSADGATLIEHASARTFSSVVFSSPSLAIGETCTLSVDGQNVAVALDGVSNGNLDGAGGWRGRW